SVLRNVSYDTLAKIEALFRKGPGWSYTWRYFVTTLVLLNCVLLAATLVTAVTGPGTHGDFKQVLHVTFAFTGICVIAPLLSLFGTVFPAAATGGDMGIKVALTRGRRTFWRTWRRFCLGPALFAGTLMFIASLEISQGTATGILPLAKGFIWSFAISLLGFANVVFVAVILSLAYVEADISEATS
ncbi:MAG: hypothetical protein AAGF50_05185, partial [Pseudomonadota bacterium]